MKILSIIIPCYNSENYIEDCIDSIANQIDENVEIIIINDGSTDNSENIIQNCLAKFPDITINYYNQKNLGAADSRNKGISYAKGNYIAFLDSDDIWLDKTWLTIKPILQREDNDLIEFDAFRFDKISNLKKGKKLFFSRLNISQDLSHNEKLKKIFSELNWAPWSRIYHHKIINNARFLSSCRIGEDIPFTTVAYLNSKKILSINHPLLGYRYNPLSITNTPKDKDIYDRKKIIEHLLNISDNEIDLFKKYLIHMTCLRIWLGLKINNFYIKNKDISLFLKTTKQKLKKYDYTNDLPIKIIILYKYNILTWLYFKINNRKIQKSKK